MENLLCCFLPAEPRYSSDRLLRSRPDHAHPWSLNLPGNYHIDFRGCRQFNPRNLDIHLWDLPQFHTRNNNRSPSLPYDTRRWSGSFIRCHSDVPLILVADYRQGDVAFLLLVDSPRQVACSFNLLAVNRSNNVSSFQADFRRRTIISN